MIGTGFGEIDATVEEGGDVDVTGVDSEEERNDPDFLADQYSEYISVI